MSRIHEALKKAEAERMANPTAAAPEIADVVAPELAEPEAFETAASEKPMVTPAPCGAEALTFAALSVRCARPEWKPDPTRMLFFNENGGGGKYETSGLEEFRTFRSRLYRIREKQPLKTVLITSALPGEGKSFMASNLSQIIVRQHGRRALLIDGDLRWSRLHQYLGAPLTPGLTDYLAGTADEFSVVQHAPMENLFFIPGGAPAANPAELIANGRLRMLVHRMAPLFDWIIIDSPPVVPVSDAGLMAQACDGVLLVVKAAKTPFEMAQRAKLELKDRPVLGVILNGVAAKSTYTSYYYDKYYKKQEKGKAKEAQQIAKGAAAGQ